MVATSYPTVCQCPFWTTKGNHTCSRLRIYYASLQSVFPLPQGRDTLRRFGGVLVTTTHSITEVYSASWWFPLVWQWQNEATSYKRGFPYRFLLIPKMDFFYAKGDHQKREKKIVSSYRVCRLTLFEFRRVDIALIESNHEKKKEVREANRHAASGMGRSVGIVICTSQRWFGSSSLCWIGFPSHSFYSPTESVGVLEILTCTVPLAIGAEHV